MSVSVDPVTTDDIRLALGELDSAGVTDDAIQAQIDMAEDMVEVSLTEPDDVSALTKRVATIDIAKYRVFTSNRQAFISNIKSSRDTTGFNVQAKVDAMRGDHRRALAILRRHDRPKTHTLGER